MTETVEACPECNRTDIYKRKGSVQGYQFDHRYRCEICGHTFDRPITKERGSGGNVASQGLARKLWEMDKDEL